MTAWGHAHVSDDAAPIPVADNDRHDDVTDGDADYTATPRFLSGQHQVAPVDAAFSLADYGFVRAGWRPMKPPGSVEVTTRRDEEMLKGFKNFLMQGDLIIIAVGLVVALAFSTLIKAFTDNVITPLINAAGGGGAGAKGLGWTISGQRIDLGAFIAAIVYFMIFMAVIYFVLVVPYRSYMKRRGTSVFGDPDPTKVCPSCLSDGLPLAATKCKFCGSEVAVTA
jgi:large conductance mechanosensitive channel